MSEDSEVVFGTDPVGQAITKKGPEFAIAYDLPRIWVTGAQVLRNGDITMLILREQTSIQMEDEDEHPAKGETLVKNVGSYVMPTEAAEMLWKLLGSQLGKEID